MKLNMNKIKYCLEFIISILFAYLIFRIITIKAIAGYISLKHIIFLIPISLALLANIIYALYKSEGKIEKIFLTIMIPVGMLYWMLVMPSQVADEMAHLWKSYEISDGIMVSSKTEATKVPKDLVHNIYPYIKNYKEMDEVLTDIPEYSETEEVNNTAKTYPTVLYMFAAIGFRIGKALNLSLVQAAYLAKLANYIVFLVASYYTIKIIPFGKLPTSILLFTPMMLHQATSTSSDALINIISILFIAFSMYMMFKKEKIEKREMIVYFVLAVLTAISKYVYLPLIGTSLLFIWNKNMTKKEKIILIVSTIVVSTALAIGGYLYSSTYPSAYEEFLESVNANSSRQITYMKENPVKVVKMILKTLKTNGETYTYEAIGSKLGWANIIVDNIWIELFILLLFASCYLEKNEVSLNKLQKSFLVLIIGAIIALVVIGLYIAWTPVGSDLSAGIQGRYFIPIIPLLILCLCIKDNYIKIKNINYTLILGAAALNVPILLTVIKYFI